MWVRPFAVAADEATAGDGDRFRIAVTWETPQGGSGVGVPVPLSPDTVAFWFFRPGNVELIVKVLDGRPVNGYFWVFGGALTNVAYTVTVTDIVTDEVWTYDNPQGRLDSFAATTALPGD